MTRGQWAVLLAASVLAVLAGLAVGAVPIGWDGLLGALHPAPAGDAALVRYLRMPRVLLAFLVGGALSVAGASLQALVRNPLADPYLVGLSGGAGLGAVLAIALHLGGPWAVPVAAFGGALGAVAIVYRLSVVTGRRLDPHILLLGGVVVGAFAGSLMSAVIILAPAAELRSAMLWLLGGFGMASWPAVAIFAAYALVPLALLAVSARGLDLLTLGEENAQHLGAEVEVLKRRVYLSVAALTGAAVAVSGIIGFVGLVVPHVMRRWGGPLHRQLLPAAFLAGGGFLVLSDLFARSLFRPMELPVGVVTALVGVPIFALQLRRSLQ
ncbi:MAG TPA: iron ABC transporter permease [Gemmatimonadales bacterium]|nr:iron ABC transporter permease [Gemmatimonadales bacterium]